MEKEEIQKLIKEEILKYMVEAQFSLTPIPGHNHTGFDGPRIAFENLLGVPTFDVIPSGETDLGTMRLYESGATRRLYVYLNGTWRFTALT